MRIPYAIQGALFGPALIGLTLVLRVACPVPLGTGCFTDHLAVPLFLPLIFIYKIVGDGLVMYHELWFVVLYWGIVGLLAGIIFDLYTHRSPY